MTTLVSLILRDISPSSLKKSVRVNMPALANLGLLFLLLAVSTSGCRTGSSGSQVADALSTGASNASGTANAATPTSTLATTGSGSGYYFKHPLTGTYTGSYVATVRGNGGFSNTFTVGPNTFSNNDYSIMLTSGGTDILTTIFDLVTGVISYSWSHPGTGSYSPTSTGPNHDEYVVQVMTLLSSAIVLRDGRPATDPDGFSAADPSSAPLAAYLQAVVTQDLNGGKAPNGIAYCPNGYQFYGIQYQCGAYTCGKSDPATTIPCVIIN